MFDVGDKVRIIKGFFDGFTGVVYIVNRPDGCLVDVEDDATVFFYNHELELIKDLKPKINFKDAKALREWLDGSNT